MSIVPDLSGLAVRAEVSPLVENLTILADSTSSSQVLRGMQCCEECRGMTSLFCYNTEPKGSYLSESLNRSAAAEISLLKF